MENSRILIKFVGILKSRNCCDCISSLSNLKNFDSLLIEAYKSLQGNISFFCLKKDVKNLKMPLLLLLDFSFITCKSHRENIVQEL